ncbi:hypothetical protein OUZ56_011912 [Daphnia magna]|uniref:Ty3 transposon capsid-like protein domain-containing protein n=1 Tax=Daphnia magna TaxID=35525 RepID=A0ABQ9Z1H3_9CRUS|nr:hypothetical protein OUZ56_011912 [Daphnia magna]
MFANTSKKNPKDDEIPTTEQDDEDAKKVNRYFTQPIVKAIGELFSREDKNAIPIFKGKSPDKLISERLRGAEHVAQNNEWDDNQKIRFFSDRLKGKAFEWHETYAQEEGDDLNYQDWKKALIKRFQDTYDLATLEKKLSKLTQKPEENCRAFVSKLNNLYDTIAEALSELKCTNTKRGSSPENDVTIAETDQYEKGRPRSSERY